MKHAATQELYSYWRSLCGSRTAPERNDIDPAAIRGILADTFMIEVDEVQPSERAYPIRLSGTRMSALFGRELKSTSLLTLWDGPSRADLADLIAAVLDNAQPAVAGGAGAPRGHAPLGLELLLLPLRHRGRTHARLMGCLSLAHTPSWLGLVSAEPLTMSSQRMIFGEPLGSRPEPRRTSPRSRADDIARRAARRAHFIVYEGGRTDDLPAGGRVSANCY